MSEQNWQLKLLKEVFDVRVSGIDKKVSDDEISVRLCNYVDVYRNRIIDGSLQLSSGSVSESELRRFELSAGDVIITKDSETPEDIANPAFVPHSLDGIVCGYHLALLRPKKELVCGEFFAYALQLKSNRHYFFTLSNGVTRFGLTTGAIGNAKFRLPPLNEQHAIASRIRAWDHAIELIDSQVLCKKQQKSGLMQKFLSWGNADWSDRKLGSLFKHRKHKGAEGLPTYSVTMNNGLVPRDSLDRKNDTSLRPDQHLLIERDDIAYNMMRMWQGASGLAPESGLVSPAYVVLRSLGEVDPLFASYWFKMPRVVKKFEDYSHGLTKDRLRLYYKDFASITLPVPPIDLQRKIAKALSACDRELDCLRRKVEFLKQQKKGLMQQLLTGKIRVKVYVG